MKLKYHKSRIISGCSCGLHAVTLAIVDPGEGGEGGVHAQDLPHPRHGRAHPGEHAGVLVHVARLAGVTLVEETKYAF